VYLVMWEMFGARWFAVPTYYGDGGRTSGYHSLLELWSPFPGPQPAERQKSGPLRYRDAVTG
jgi:hypothetical protein